MVYNAPSLGPPTTYAATLNHKCCQRFVVYSAPSLAPPQPATAWLPVTHEWLSVAAPNPCLLAALNPNPPYPVLQTVGPVWGE